MVERTVGEPLSSVLTSAEPGYGLLNWFGANIFGGVYFVNTVCAIFSIGLLLFLRSQPRPWLALTLAVPT